MNTEETPARSRGVPAWHAELIRHYPILESLPVGLMRELQAQAVPIRIPVGAIAFEQDSSCSGLVLITDGCVRVVRSGPQGREIMLYRVRPGENCILSVSCLLGRAPIAARGIVEAELTGVLIPGLLFESMVSACPPFRMFIFELFGSRISALLQLVEQIAFHRLDQRLASLLLQRFEESDRAEIAITHQDLADQVGSAREVVSRLLEAFESAGGIELGRAKVKLLCPDPLRQTAGVAGEKPAEAPSTLRDRSH